jgi:hypothetical protein
MGSPPGRGAGNLDLPSRLALTYVTSDEADGIKRRITSGFSAAASSDDTVLPYFETFAEQLVDVASPAVRPCARRSLGLVETLRGVGFDTVSASRVAG